MVLDCSRNVHAFVAFEKKYYLHGYFRGSFGSFLRAFEAARRSSRGLQIHGMQCHFAQFYLFDYHLRVLKKGNFRLYIVILSLYCSFFCLHTFGIIIIVIL